MWREALQRAHNITLHKGLHASKSLCFGVLGQFSLDRRGSSISLVGGEAIQSYKLFLGPDHQGHCGAHSVSNNPGVGM
jgi:hypothetical protein